MLGLGKPKPVAEHEAEGEIERVYYEIRQVLRVSGLNLNFRTWAVFDKFLPAMWDQLRPNLETRVFEDAADLVRARALGHAKTMGQLHAAPHARLGESQVYQVRKALDLYHYINPKLLVLTASVSMALDGEAVGQTPAPELAAPLASPTGIELIERGVPQAMFPMEMVDEEPEDKRLRELFEDIKQTLELSSINSDYRTLALWPDYLENAWRRLKPFTQRNDYRAASDELGRTARDTASELPYRLVLTRKDVEDLGEDAEQVVRITRQFERLLPPLILNVALMSLDWKEAEALERSPFPVAAPGRR